MAGNKYCSNCGIKIDETTEFCPNCGVKQVSPPGDQETYKEEIICSNCSAKVKPGLKFCTKCGAEIKQMNSPGQQETYKKNIRNIKNPGLAAILSFFIVGLGQIYNGQNRKGFFLLLAAIISGILWLVYIGIIFSIILWIYAIFDAYTTAQRINAGEIIT